jgi:hypothetical protein
MKASGIVCFESLAANFSARPSSCRRRSIESWIAHHIRESHQWLTDKMHEPIVFGLTSDRYKSYGFVKVQDCVRETPRTKLLRARVTRKRNPEQSGQIKQSSPSFRPGAT